MDSSGCWATIGLGLLCWGVLSLPTGLLVARILGVCWRGTPGAPEGCDE